MKSQFEKPRTLSAEERARRQEAKQSALAETAPTITRKKEGAKKQKVSAGTALSHDNESSIVSALEREKNNATIEHESHEPLPLDPDYGRIISPEEYERYSYTPQEIEAMEKSGEITLSEDLNRFDIFDLPESHDSRFDDQHLDKSMKAASPKKNEASSNFSRYLGQNHPEVAERGPGNMPASELEERKAFNSFREKLTKLPPPFIMDAASSGDNLVVDGITWFTEQEKPFWNKFRNEISSEIEFRKKYYQGSEIRQETLADIESRIRHLAYYPEKKSEGRSGNNAWHFLKEKFLNFKKRSIDRSRINDFLDAQSEYPGDDE